MALVAVTFLTCFDLGCERGHGHWSFSAWLTNLLACATQGTREPGGIHRVCAELGHIVIHRS